MKRTVFSAAVLSLTLISGGVAFAGHGDEEPGPGPNGHNNYGLCKAFFAGEGNGKGQGAGKKEDKGPFPAMFTAAGDQDGDDDVDRDDVALWCEDQTPGGKGGN